MSGADQDAPGDPNKRQILRPGDSLLDTSADAGDRAEARARAARRILEDREAERLGWLGRLWRRIAAFLARYFGGAWRTLKAVVTRYLPGVSRIVAGAFAVVTRAWTGAVWPAIDAIAHKTNAKGERKLSLAGKVLLAAVVFFVAWPLFKIYYVLATQRDFHDVSITFKQIITHERYLVFGDYQDGEGHVENMAFNVTDSWVYWNWTPDLTFAQIPLVGKCSFRTYGWYVRVPRFVPFLGRTLLVEPVVISASCTAADGSPTGPT